MAILLCLESHPILSESTVNRNGAQFHVFQTLTSGLWNLTAVCSEFLEQSAEMDEIEAMKTSLNERTRISCQIAAQSRGIIDLHDNQMSAALNFLFSVCANRADFHSA